MNFVKKTITLTLILTLLLVNFSFAITNRQEKWFKLMEDNYIGKGIGIDQDGVYAYQCVDVPSHYAAYIFPINQHPFDYKKTLNWGNAAQLYSQAYSTYFEKIPMSPTARPKRGDIVVWDGPTYEGHIAVIAGADEKGMTLIHQFGYRQDGVWKTVDPYSYPYYGNIIGFLRPKADKIKLLNKGSDGEQFNPEPKEEDKLLVRGTGILRPEEIELEKRKFNSKEYNACMDLGIIKQGSGVESNAYLTRLEGIVFVLRVSGEEKTALSVDNSTLKNVEDKKSIPDWGLSYSAYALSNGIIKGVKTLNNGNIIYSPESKLTGEQLVTLIMRALGNEGVEPATAKKLFLEKVESNTELAKLINDRNITRDDAGKLIFSFIKNSNIQKNKENSVKLSDYLISKGIFTESQFKNTLK